MKVYEVGFNLGDDHGGSIWIRSNYPLRCVSKDEAYTDFYVTELLPPYDMIDDDDIDIIVEG